MTPASPLPWHVGPHYKTDVESGAGRVAETGAIGSPNGIRNAAYIVIACNAYPSLVAALKFASDAYCLNYCGERAHDKKCTELQAALQLAEGSIDPQREKDKA